MLNTGPDVVFSKHGLLTTPCYKLNKNDPPCYALEGSVEMGGASIEWAKNNLKLFSNMNEFQSLLESVSSSQGVYFVPSFSGLFAPYWDDTAKGLIIGLSQMTNRAHLVRAIVDGMCLRVCDVMKAMSLDLKHPIDTIKVDGGVTVNDYIMKLQADYCRAKIVRREISEITSLGCCIAAGIGCGMWKSIRDLEGIIKDKNTIEPANNIDDAVMKSWELAKSKARNWKME
jgi:glycerol kinase